MPDQPIIDAVRRSFERVGTDPDGALAELAPLYAEDMFFKDPIQTVHGREGFFEATRRLVRRTRDVRFTVHDGCEGREQVFLAWTMSFTLPLGGRVEIDGTSHLTVRGGVIVAHVDYWDLLGSVVGCIPLAGAVYRRAVALLG